MLLFSGSSLFIINPKLGDKLIVSSTDNYINNNKEQSSENENENIQNAVTWKFYESEKDKLFENGFRIELNHMKVCFFI